MKTLTFKRGVHPLDNKGDTNAKEIITLPAPETLVIPLAQHIGAPCEPLVKKGDRVLMWQKIGESSAKISSPVHSSASGIVQAVEPRLSPNGLMINSVVIKNDFEDEKAPGIKPPAAPEKMSRGELSALVREAGVVGMGGAGFPTHIKLEGEKRIDFVIINGAECEPYLTSDHRVMLETPEDVIFGLRAIMSAIGTGEAYIGVEENKGDAILALSAAARDFKGIHIARLKTKYPQGSEKQLIETITGRQVPSGGLPADVGVLTLNIDTCTAITRAVKTGAPLVRRIVTVGGPAIKNPSNFAVRLGASFAALIEAAGGFIEPPAKVIMGGPMMGLAQMSIDVPVVKGTSAILAFREGDLDKSEQSACIRCGRCAFACPINLAPYEITARAGIADWEGGAALGARECIECGCCEYVCPAKRNLVQYMRLAKQKASAM